MLLHVVAAVLAQSPRPGAYSGLSVRDSRVGPVVGAVRPGPFGGNTYTSPTLVRGDFVVRVRAGGRALTADGTGESALTNATFDALMNALAPGDSIEVVYRRAADGEAHVYDAMPRPDPAGEERTCSAVLDSAEDWRSPLKMGLRDGAKFDGAEEGLAERVVLDAIARARPGGEAEDPAAVVAYVGAQQHALMDRNALEPVVHALTRPLSIDAVERRFRALAVRVAKDPAAWPDLVRPVLDVPGAPPAGDAPNPLSDLVALARAMRDSADIDGPETKDRLRALREAGPAMERALAFGLSVWPVMRSWELAGAAQSGRTALRELPEKIRDAVEGDILYTIDMPGGAVGVVGGRGTNRYDMTRIADVYDLGGDDTYEWTDPSLTALRGNHHIIDLGGNDRYASRADFCGPGVGTGAVSVVDDRAGDDEYSSSSMFSIGAGLLGAGVIIDHAGNDRYVNLGPGSGWSIGAGFFGAGLVIDLGGDDAYEGGVLVQGVGGARGLGAIIDAAGNDRYLARSADFPSAYGTPGVSLTMGQGFGYGVRGYASGGIGAIEDLAGNDTYDCGEFGQACGYFFGVGILGDASGNDRYRGDRYVQGSAAHQAAGVLVESEGDDEYVCTGAACQGGAWDQSVGALFDERGRDRYSGGGLGQGSGAQQAIGLLADLAGDDVYTGGSPLQGECGSNEYHWLNDRVLSLGVLLDRAGEDTYSSRRANGAVTTTGVRHADDGGASTLFGFCIDE